jgi:hypothetical protein
MLAEQASHGHYHSCGYSSLTPALQAYRHHHHLPLTRRMPLLCYIHLLASTPHVQQVVAATRKVCISAALIAEQVVP